MAKADNVLISVILGGLVAVSAGAIGMLIQSNKSGKYVITGKGANKIEYCSLKSPYDTHVMTFDGDTAFAHGGWYPYLSVGDTISGPAIIMDEPIANSAYYHGLRPPILVPTIESTNGKLLRQVREIARRDSIVRQIRQKQK